MRLFSESEAFGPQSVADFECASQSLQQLQQCGSYYRGVGGVVLQQCWSSQYYDPQLWRIMYSSPTTEIKISSSCVERGFRTHLEADLEAFRLSPSTCSSSSSCYRRLYSYWVKLKGSIFFQYIETAAEVLVGCIFIHIGRSEEAADWLHVPRNCSV